jgi:hypothetical protein
MRRQPAGDEQYQKCWSFGPAYRPGTPASGRRHAVRRCTAEIRPLPGTPPNPGDLNVMIWNAAIYCALVVQDVVIVGLCRTLVLQASANQGSCCALGRMTLPYKPVSSPPNCEGRLYRDRAPGQWRGKDARRSAALPPAQHARRLDRGRRKPRRSARYRPAGTARRKSPREIPTSARGRPKRPHRAWWAARRAGSERTMR